MERLAGRVILLWGWRRYALALAAGGLLVLAQAPVDFAAAGFVSFPLLIWLLDGATERSPVSLWRRFWPFFAVGWWFGLGYFLAGLWWVGNAVFVEAESFLWALPFMVLGLPLLMAPFFGLATVLSRLFWDDGLGRILSLAFGFAIAEWLRGWAFTGFPWNPVGYGLMPTPLLMQSAHEIGTAGMNAAAVFLFAAPALVVGGRLWRTGLSLALLLGLLHVGYGAWRLSAPVVDARMLPVRIVQPSIDLSEKWDGAVRDRVLQTTLDLSQGPPPEGAEAPELIVWPETAVPFLLTERPDALAAIGAVGESGRLVLAGAVRAEAQQSGTQPLFYNSLVAVGADGTIVDAVDKVHLVPFGEYLPFQPIFDQFGVTQIVAGPMNFAPGA
ncbi:MAG: apolipoprotein N-acyltransferase, partial [Mesorhizobium amorphae]